MNKPSKDSLQALAEAKFKRKEMQAREGAQAMAEYQAAQVAERKKTERLRAMRLAKEAADRAAAEAPMPPAMKPKAAAKAAKPAGGAKKKR